MHTDLIHSILTALSELWFPELGLPGSKDHSGGPEDHNAKRPKDLKLSSFALQQHLQFSALKRRHRAAILLLRS